MIIDKKGKIFDDRRKNDERRIKEKAVNVDQRKIQRRAENKKQG